MSAHLFQGIIAASVTTKQKMGQYVFNISIGLYLCIAREADFFSIDLSAVPEEPCSAKEPKLTEARLPNKAHSGLLGLAAGPGFLFVPLRRGSHSYISPPAYILGGSWDLVSPVTIRRVISPCTSSC